MSLLTLSDIDQVQAVLAEHGYHSHASSPWLDVPLPAGSTITLQFGDQVLAGPDRRPQLMVRCACQINGDTQPSASMTRWSFERRQPADGIDGFDLLLKADLQLAISDDFGVPTDLRQATAAIQSSQAYHHLHALMADARRTLRDIPIDRRRSEPAGPAMRLEARFLGDLVMGRTGLIRPSLQASSTYKQLSLAVCDWLTGRILPDLRRVVRDLSVRSNALHSDVMPVAMVQKVAPRSLTQQLAPSHEHETIQ